MIILNTMNIEIKGESMFEFEIRANNGEDFKEDSLFYVGNKKFKVFESQKFGPLLAPVYRVVAKYKPQITKFNYDSVDWMFNVHSLERIDALTIAIVKQNGRTIITLDTPEECLQEFLLLKILQKEVMSNEEFYELRR